MVSRAAMGAIGLWADERAAPERVFPEEASQETSLEAETDAPASTGLVSVGARGYRVQSHRADATPRAEAGRSPLRCDFRENDKYSSGGRGE